MQMICEVRIRRVLGLPAILGEAMVGHVERAVLTRDGRHLRGLMIRRGLGSAKWVPGEHIRVLGDVSVILGQRPVRPPRDTAFTLRTVKDESGLTLGRVTDAWISTETLDVTAIEVTLGLLEDLRTGRRRVTQWAVQGMDGNAGGEAAGQVLIPREEWEVSG